MKTACKKHRHFCIVALFFPLPTETNRGADHRPVSHTNALCALFRRRTGIHTKGQYFPFFAVVLEKEGKRGLRFCTLSLERVRASHSTGRGTPAPCLLLTRRAEALHPLTFFGKKVSKETLKQKGASIFEKQENEYTHQRGTPRCHTPQGRASGYDLHRLRDKSLPRQTDRGHRRTG